MFKLGCDPELFLQDAAGALRSGIGLIGGSKAQPRPLPLGDGYAVQEDNVALEFNVPAADNVEAWDSSIGNTVAFLEQTMEKHYGLKFSNLSAAFFPQDQLNNPAALEFGCEPDYNAWTGEKNPRPKAPDATLRSCGGHVHVGWKAKDDNEKRRLIKLMDFWLGIPSVLLDDGDLRKQLYGAAGACRLKNYGAEYRTLSNFWIFQKPLRTWVWNNTSKAMGALRSDFDIDALKDRVLHTINNNDKAEALAMVKEFNIPLAYA